jgi:hypothetical protein
MEDDSVSVNVLKDDHCLQFVSLNGIGRETLSIPAGTNGYRTAIRSHCKTGTGNFRVSKLFSMYENNENRNTKV